MNQNDVYLTDEDRNILMAQNYSIDRILKDRHDRKVQAGIASLFHCASFSTWREYVAIEADVLHAATPMTLTEAMDIDSSRNGFTTQLRDEARAIVDEEYRLNYAYQGGE